MLFEHEMNKEEVDISIAERVNRAIRAETLRLAAASGTVAVLSIIELFPDILAMVPIIGRGNDNSFAPINEVDLALLLRGRRPTGYSGIMGRERPFASGHFPFEGVAVLPAEFSRLSV